MDHWKRARIKGGGGFSLAGLLLGKEKNLPIAGVVKWASHCSLQGAVTAGWRLFKAS